MGGGMVFRVDGALFYLPATVARKVVSMPPVVRVPGATTELLGVALVEGEMVPVVMVGNMLEALPAKMVDPSQKEPRPMLMPKPTPMLVCTHLGERLCLVGLEPISTGAFDGGGPASANDAGLVFYNGNPVALFDVGRIVSRLRDSTWRTETEAARGNPVESGLSAMTKRL